MDNSKTVDMGAVVAGVIWGLAAVLCVTAGVVGIVWHDYSLARMIAIALVSLGALASAVAASLTVRMMLRCQTRYIVRTLRLMADSPDVPQLRRISR